MLGPRVWRDKEERTERDARGRRCGPVTLTLEPSSHDRETYDKPRASVRLCRYARI
jgi:hypothetical protein